MREPAYHQSACLSVLMGAVFFLLVGPAESSPIKIGGIFDLSSDAGAIWGNSEKDGFLLAIEDFKAAHPDTEIQYRLEDSAYSATASVSAFHKLTSIDGIRLIVGPTWEPFVAVMPLCQSRRVLCFAPSNFGPAFREPAAQNGFAFTAWYDERGYASTIADEINRRGLKRVAVISAVSEYHDLLVDTLVHGLHVKPVFQERVLETQASFKSIITRLPRDVEALVILISGQGPVLAFYKEVGELRKEKLPVFSDDTVLGIGPEVKPLLNRVASEFLYSAPVMEKEYSEKWAKAYVARYGKAPAASAAAAVSYDETSILLNCALHSSDTAAIRDCVKATSGYKGASGILSFAGSNAVTGRSFELVKGTD